MTHKDVFEIFYLSVFVNFNASSLGLDFHKPWLGDWV
jgi:hypothetical protein